MLAPSITPLHFSEDITKYGIVVLIVIANSVSSISTMVKFTDLPPEIHVQIAKELIPAGIVNPGSNLNRVLLKEQDIYAMALLSRYWAGISHTAVGQRLRDADPKLRAARQQFLEVNKKRDPAVAELSSVYRTMCNWGAKVNLLEALQTCFSEMHGVKEEGN